MTETVNYPLPTVHLNGTGKKMLLEGNLKILGKINELKKQFRIANSMAETTMSMTLTIPLSVEPMG